MKFTYINRKNNGKSLLLLVVCLIAALFAAAGCQNQTEEAKPDTVVLPRSQMESDEMIQSLLDRNGTLIGESPVIKELVCDILPGKICVISYDITLNRLTIKYGSTPQEEIDKAKAENDGADETETELNPEQFAKYWDKQTTEDILFYNASALFALIPNLDSVQYMVENYGQPTFTISRQNMEAFYGYALADIDSVSLWKTKITEVFNDDLKIAEFYKQYPLNTKAAQPDDTEAADGTNADTTPDNTADSTLDYTQTTEQPQVILPDEVQ